MLADLFDDVAPGSGSLLDAVREDWAERNHMQPGRVPQGWRQDRLVYELSLPANGWFIDIERAESIAVIGAALQHQFVTLGIDSLTTAELRGSRREVTTMVADWLRGQTLDDGTLPHGIMFGSKHDSSWHCWAIWLRAVDDGKTKAAEPTKATKGSEIDPCEHNPALRHIVNLFNLKCF